MKNESGVATPPDIRAYDFYRCHECGWMFTRLEEIRDAFTSGHACKRCGSRKYHPASYRWYFRFFPKVLFYWFRVRKHYSTPAEITKPTLILHGLMKGA